MAHFASASKINSILNVLASFPALSVCILIALSGAFTNRTDSFRIFTKLFSVFVGSFACGGGYGN